MLRTSLLIVLVLFSANAAEDDPAAHAEANAIDQELRQLSKLADARRPDAINSLAPRIRRQPARYAVALANNLATDGTDGSDRETIQQIADTLVQALRDAPANVVGSGYKTLAELVHYDDVRVSVNHPQYSAALEELKRVDEHRHNADFTLSDLQGQQWTLKALRGRVVLVNFWATWCPPCRQEAPDLETVYKRYKQRGFVVLAISEEEPEPVKTFVAEHHLSYPVLLDREQKLKETFLVHGLPLTLVYDQAGKLVGQSRGRPSAKRLAEMLKAAGLR